jgi:hypothetical protein
MTSVQRRMGCDSVAAITLSPPLAFMIAPMLDLDRVELNGSRLQYDCRA